MIDLLLINPSLDWKLEREKKLVARLEPDVPYGEAPNIGIAYLLASAKQAGIKVRYCDMVADGISGDGLIALIKKERPSLIGFTAFTVQINAAGILASEIKKVPPNQTIMVGGCHASTIPVQTLEEFPAFDFVVCGEGEETVRRVIESNNGFDSLPGVVTRQRHNKRGSVPDIDSIPFPAWDEFDLSKYPGCCPLYPNRKELQIVTSRGCPFQCTFCCRALGSKSRRRCVDSVISEVENNIERYGCELIEFLDETFILDREWSAEFFQEMIKRGLNKKIQWGCSTRVSNTSPELFARMREAGCYYIFFGLESADNDTLKRIKKGTTVEEIKQSVEWCKMAGIIPIGAFIIGLEGDTEEHVHKDIALGRELDLFSITFPVAVPFPGTVLRALASKGSYGLRVTSNNWDDYGKQGVGVMESIDFPLSRRQELKDFAYSQFPKQKLSDYLERQRSKGYPFY